MRNRVLALALSLLASPSMATPSTGAEPRGIVRGRAVEPNRTTGVTGASIAIETVARVVTTGNGAFVLSGIPAGHRVVTCAARGFSPGRVEVDVVPGGTHEVTCVLGALAVDKASAVKKAARAASASGSAVVTLGTIGTIGHGSGSAMGLRGYGAGGGGVGQGDGVGIGVGGLVGGHSLGTAGAVRSGYGSGAGYGAGRLGGGMYEARALRPSAHVLVHGGTPLAKGPHGGGALAPSSEESREGYDSVAESDFTAVTQAPLSTFSIDVDSASYSNVRRLVAGGHRPPRDAVRIEELVNYFHYDYPEPTAGEPFSVTLDVSEAPWKSEHRLVRIGLQGPHIPAAQLPPTHLTFLIDVSGSMNHPLRLPLLKQSFRLLIDQLRPQDTVALVVYAGAAGVVLPPTEGSRKAEILGALDRLHAGGSTAGAAGIRLAYQVARQQFVQGENNRVILATDGDFNVGTSSDGELVELIEHERKSGVFLTLLGYGMGNYQDAKLQKLADAGNGHHAYIDSLAEARKTLVAELGATLLTVAKDVKLQVEFNPARVQAYRLIGYDNRRLADRDFDDDAKDAGELGAGHSVTALYEIVPVGTKEPIPAAGPLKYQTASATPAAAGEELMTVKLRYKAPDAEQSRLLSRVLVDRPLPLEQTSRDFRFASAVAEVGLLLRGSAHKGRASFDAAIARAEGALGGDVGGLRAGFVSLARAAAALAGQPATRQ